MTAGIGGPGGAPAGGGWQVPGVVGITLEGAAEDVAKMAGLLWCAAGAEMLSQSGQHRDGPEPGVRVHLTARITFGGQS